MFDDVKFSSKALEYARTWRDAWTWMCDALNLMVRGDEKPGMMPSFEVSTRGLTGAPYFRTWCLGATRPSGRPSRRLRGNLVST